MKDKKNKELENQIKNIKFKAELQSNIEKDITKRRAMSMKQKLVDAETQTETQPPSEFAQKLELIKERESKSDIDKSIDKSIDVSRDQITQTAELPNTKVVIKRSSSIGKLDKLKKKKKLKRPGSKRKRNNSEAECLSASLLSLAELLPSENSMLILC